MTGVRVVDAESVPWVNGRDVFASMEPAFRDNLSPDGDHERAAELLSRYSMRSLWLDPATTRRIDHIRADPGYVDLSEAYHDSVEEALFLDGRVRLSAEGDMEEGDYFWRPPGWVHSAASPEGFEALLMMEGEDASEGSGRVSRVVRPDDRVGHNDRPLAGADADAHRLGPRGYVRRAETRFMVWRDHDDRVTGLASAGADGLRSKVLSANARTGACSTLVRLPAGWSQPVAPSTRERFVVVTDGELAADGARLGRGSLVHLPPGATATLRADGTATVLVKAGAPR